MISPYTQITIYFVSDNCIAKKHSLDIQKVNIYNLQEHRRMKWPYYIQQISKYTFKIYIQVKEIRQNEGKVWEKMLM